MPPDHNHISLPKFSIALLLPPIQSLQMPYSAPFSIAAWLKSTYDFSTLTLDCGIEWLNYEIGSNNPEIKDAFEALRNEKTYADAMSLRASFFEARKALDRICHSFYPEKVLLSGEYVAPAVFQSWKQVKSAVEKRKDHLFDSYYRYRLLPKLESFVPDIIGLSLPFDWMVFPALRLTRLLRERFPNAQIILGGPVIRRLWYDRQIDFFKMLEADWVSIGSGEQSFMDLFNFLRRSEPVPSHSPLIKLPIASTAILNSSRRTPGLFSNRLVPDYSDLTLSEYLRPKPVLPVPASEGCYYARCLFCSRQRMEQSIPFREQDPIEVGRTMSILSRDYSVEEFILCADILTPKFLLSLSRFLESAGSRFRWFCETSFKSRMVEKMTGQDFEQLYRGGCRIILNGLESGSDEVRKLMNCPVDQGKFDEMIARIVLSGIIPYVTLIVGYPGETTGDLVQTIDYVKRRLNHTVFAISKFQLVPNTPLYSCLLKDPRFLCKKENVLDANYSLVEKEANRDQLLEEILNRELSGLFGQFPEFLRSIPTLLQMISKTEEENLIRVAYK